jgi:ligand-binding sensor domain-containing protein
MPLKKIQTYTRSALQLACGILIIALVIVVLQTMTGVMQVQGTPPGWTIIRPPGEVSTLVIVNDTVWTGGKDGVILVDRLSGAGRKPPGNAPAFGYVRQILQDRQGWIWVGHDGGLACYRQGSWDVVAPAPGVPFIKVLSLAERRDGAIIIGTDGEVYSFNGREWQSLLNSPGSLASADVLYEDNNGDLWAGCGSPAHGALYRLSGTTWTPFTVSNGLPHPAVRAITADKNGSVWVATGYSRMGGAARFDGKNWIGLTRADGLAGESTRSVYQDMSGRMWIGSEYDGIAVGTPGSWKILTEKDGLAGYEVKVMAQDPDGTFWLGTNHGLSRIEPGSLGL